MMRGLYCHLGSMGLLQRVCVYVYVYVCVFRGLCHPLPDTMLMSMACAAAEGYDVPWHMLQQRAVLMSMVCTATRDHAEVHSMC